MLGVELDLQTFLKGVSTWCEQSGFSYRYDDNNDADVYTIRFDLGPKWALFFAKETQAVVDDLKIRNTEIQVTNNTVTIKSKDKQETNPKWVAS